MVPQFHSHCCGNCRMIGLRATMMKRADSEAEADSSGRGSWPLRKFVVFERKFTMHWGEDASECDAKRQKCSTYFKHFQAFSSIFQHLLFNFALALFGKPDMMVAQGVFGWRRRKLFHRLRHWLPKSVACRSACGANCQELDSKNSYHIFLRVWLCAAQCPKCLLIHVNMCEPVQMMHVSTWSPKELMGTLYSTGLDEEL